MRFSSPKRITLASTVVGGGMALLLLLLFSAMGVSGSAGTAGHKRQALPTKTDRSVSAGSPAARPLVDEEGAVAKVGSGAEKRSKAQSGKNDSKSEEAKGKPDADRNVAAVTAGEGKTTSNLSRLRRRLLERAGHLALQGEDPAKNLVLVAQTYYRGGDHQSALRWFEKARRMATDPDNSTNSSVALREVVKGLLSVGEYGMAVELVGQIPLQAEQDRARAEVATTFARKKLFEEAIQIANTLTEQNARALALRGVADAQARYGSLDDAISTVNGIPFGKLRDDAWMRVALARAGKGDSAGAAGVLARISNDRTRDLAGLKVAEAQAKSGGRASIEVLLAAMHDPFLRDESLRRIVEVQASRSNYTEAEASAFRITDRNEQALAMESLVSLQVRNGDLSGALLRARDIQVPGSRARALQNVALGVTAAQGAAAGRNVVGLIMDPKQRDLSYRRVAERAASLGQPLDALMTVYNIQAPEERAATLAVLAQWRARRGAVNPARLLLEDAVREVQQIPQQKNQEKALGILATAYAEADDSISALSTAASIENIGLRDRAYQQLARKFAAESDIKLAEQSAQAIQVEKTRLSALDSMAQTIAGKVPPSKALNVVGKFEERRQQVKFLVTVAGRI